MLKRIFIFIALLLPTYSYSATFDEQWQDNNGNEIFYSSNKHNFKMFFGWINDRLDFAIMYKDPSYNCSKSTIETVFYLNEQAIKGDLSCINDFIYIQPQTESALIFILDKFSNSDHVYLGQNKVIINNFKEMMNKVIFPAMEAI